MRVFLAEGVRETCVALRAPAATVPCDHLEMGSLVLLRPRPGVYGQLRLAFEPPRSASWRMLGRSPGEYRFVVHQGDRAALHRSIEAAVRTLRRWPILSGHVGLADPSPRLARTLWDLSGLLIERDRVRRTRDRLTDVDPAVPPDTPLRAELADRAAQARLRLRHLGVQARDQLTHLTRLAAETDAFVRHEQASAAARAALRASDYLLSPAAPAPPDDEALDLADHTSAVLRAYRELTA
ncbi:hypothetical protein ACWT_5241 [Actinoplanes sp. SE50]|uniref:hypothetical protein n=1 Tax=unclassified Actinoplanes TaxID=2626549 RepID=UPI00023EBD9F|nr:MULTISPECIES: hypothetical protein [unclassified Actinoplanes]AEV86259.1 hypothetical protein ACPL_5372 [Actinoplanes sp. SE50/110]ATO84656.1 hypothetical protein ACWT_5241 [Actinoplanes sp. SE50]SLM02066.1 hypothetical protein ACSP50_5304 [Actinoplanes sp. SE50/110]